MCLCVFNRFLRALKRVHVFFRFSEDVFISVQVCSCVFMCVLVRSSGFIYVKVCNIF